MRKASKLPARQIVLSDFTGGIDKTIPPELLPENKAQELINFEIEANTGILKTIDGMRKLWTTNTPFS